MSLVFVLYLCHGPAMSYGFDNVGRSNEGTKSKHPPRVENCGNDPWWIACRNGGYIPPNISCRSDAKLSFDGRWVRHCDANSTENRILVLGAAGLHGSDALSTFFGACVVSFSSVRCPLNVVVTTQNAHPTSTIQPQQWLGQESRIGPQSTSCWARFRTVTACGFKTCWELGTSALFSVLGREFPLERAGTTAVQKILASTYWTEAAPVYVSINQKRRTFLVRKATNMVGWYSTRNSSRPGLRMYLNA